MKKCLLVFMTLLTLGSMKSHAQVFKPGDFAADAYIGWPNLWTAVIRSAYNDNSNFDNDGGVKISSFGPVGLRAEYLISERIGLGLNFNYATTSVKGTIYEEFDDNGNFIDTYYSYKASLPRWRLMPTFFVHIGNSDKVDPYVAIGAGYNSSKLVEKTNDPYYNAGSVNINLTHVAFRAEFGVRYFFTEHVGIHGQFGLGGGPLLAMGLSTKF